MRALSLTQPWATLVVTGQKRVETRSWPTGIRERIAIHASKGMPPYAVEAAREFGLDPDALPRGAIVGYVSLVGCSPTHLVRHNVSAEELVYGDFADGRFAWFLTNPTEEREPIPARGALGFWQWTPR